MIIYSTSLNTQAKVIAIYGGTTWQLIDAGRTLIAAGTGYTVKAKGGSKDAIVVSHTHDIDAVDTGNMSANSSHAHQIKGEYYKRGYGDAETYGYINASGSKSGNSVTASTQHTHKVPAHTTKSAGSSGTNANMQPYYVVYIWERTA